jgi:hypothetical protein
LGSSTNLAHCLVARSCARFGLRSLLGQRAGSAGAFVVADNSVFGNHFADAAISGSDMGRLHSSLLGGSKDHSVCKSLASTFFLRLRSGRVVTNNSVFVNHVGFTAMSRRDAVGLHNRILGRRGNRYPASCSLEGHWLLDRFRRHREPTSQGSKAMDQCAQE